MRLKVHRLSNEKSVSTKYGDPLSPRDSHPKKQLNWYYLLALSVRLLDDFASPVWLLETCFGFDVSFSV